MLCGSPLMKASISWACAFHQDKASSVKVPVANVTLSSSAHLLRENTDSRTFKPGDEINMFIGNSSEVAMAAAFAFRAERCHLNRLPDGIQSLEMSIDQTVPGKDILNLLIADSLLKTIRLSIHLVVYNEELAIPEQTATGKGISNLLMARSLPKTTKPI
ncbi:hypothetical protein Tco_1561582 [Tanacetum coccineum]